jgi:hypothetical protein
MQTVQPDLNVLKSFLSNVKNMIKRDYNNSPDVETPWNWDYSQPIPNQMASRLFKNSCDIGCPIYKNGIQFTVESVGKTFVIPDKMMSDFTLQCAIRYGVNEIDAWTYHKKILEVWKKAPVKHTV